jgi:hypothetical protein
MNTQEGAEQNDVRKLADLEEGLTVTAGSLDTAAFYRRVERQRYLSHATTAPFMPVFGRFLNMARRERSLTLEQLAEQIGTNACEL